ncbi:MAG: hypothetical protein VKO65_08780 [Cyanobacteriota bacterium]|nr:hypothetical protein [Cyanobacteriota bacterium]
MATPANRHAIGLAGSLLMLLTGCATTPAPRQLELTLELATERPLAAAGVGTATSGERMTVVPGSLNCQGAGEYQDLVPGAEVVVRDERRQPIGRARLGQGRVIEQTRARSGAESFQGCRFRLTIPLEKPARIYTLELDDGEFVNHYHVTELHRRGGQLLLSME